MTALERSLAELKAYDGRPLTFMEVCGTHTAAIFRSGLRDVLPPAIRLVSGPGCPVCVTSEGVIDRLLDYALSPDTCVLSFGDMLKVPGRRGSLMSRRGDGAAFRMIYSPFQAVELAKEQPDTHFVAAAVGFETTAPAWALAAQQAFRLNLKNLNFLTSLKAILPAMDALCHSENAIDGFICPGHVSTILGSDAYGPLCESRRKPMAVAGFEPEHLVMAVLALVRQCQRGEARVQNLYPEAVSAAGNPRAQTLLAHALEPGDAHWRGLGVIPQSGLYLRGDYELLDAGSRDVAEAEAASPCRCADVLRGRIHPDTCPMFGHCTPSNPLGACMVSEEGACGIWFSNRDMK